MLELCGKMLELELTTSNRPVFFAGTTSQICWNYHCSELKAFFFFLLRPTRPARAAMAKSFSAMVGEQFLLRLVFTGARQAQAMVYAQRPQ